MDDDNALDDIDETSSLHSLGKETLNNTTLSKFNQSISLLMTDKSSTNPPLTSTSNDPGLSPTATQGVIQRRTTMEPLPINENNRSQSSIICDKAKSIIDIHHHHLTQSSMDKSNEQIST